MKRLSDFFYRLIRPSFWIQNHRTDYKYDEILNELLDNHEIIIRSNNTIILNGLVVWTSNYPYAYGIPYDKEDILPRPRTRVRLQHMVTLARYKQQLNK